MIYKKITIKNGEKIMLFMKKSEFISQINDRAAHETQQSVENAVRIMELDNTITFNFGSECFTVTTIQNLPENDLYYSN